MFDRTFKLFYSAYLKNQLKNTAQPEIVFFGRSNVGKSSLINSVCQHKTLAKTSKTPGRTGSINFFTNRSENLLIVDLPGYGFAKTNKNDKQKWEGLILHYLETSENIKRAFILVDSRRSIMDSDLEVVELFESLQIPYQILLTKCDAKVDLKTKFRSGEVITFENRADRLVGISDEITSLLQNRECFVEPIFVTSVNKKTGIQNLRKYIENIIKNES
jgi:GTP-binding protein